MQKIAINCSWADVQVLSDVALCANLPQEIIAAIRSPSGAEYLEALALATLIPECGDTFLVLYEHLLVELAARWIQMLGSGNLEVDIRILSCLSRILPFAPYLKPHVFSVLDRRKGLADYIDIAPQPKRELSVKLLLPFLLALFRLLSYDNKNFHTLVPPAQLVALLGHHDLPVRYLAIRCLALLTKVADAAVCEAVTGRIGHQSIKGNWENKVIEYRLLSLWEETRWKKLEMALIHARTRRNNLPSSHSRLLTAEMLSFQTAGLAGVLLPRNGSKSTSSTSFVGIDTTLRNLERLAHALTESRPVLLTGPAGAGKSLLVTEAARQLNHLSTMFVLHLNEQTDAKSLLGVYTSSAGAGSFSWQPGVLTRAVQQGRWVLIEDIHRAPTDVLSSILPLLDKGELLIPGRMEKIQAATGFRILATSTTGERAGITNAKDSRLSIGGRLWTSIQVDPPNDAEIEKILEIKFPLLRLHIRSALKAHHRVVVECVQHPAVRIMRNRTPGLRDLLKWCRRMQRRLRSVGQRTGNDAVPGSVKDDFFLDAVLCYAGHFADHYVKGIIAGCIAEELHISPQRAHHLQERFISTTSGKTRIIIGRAILQTQPRKSHSSPFPLGPKTSPFAATQQALRTTESIASAVVEAEPVLLVGETGIGKTTLVQHLAKLTGQRLTVVNLSQQSESNDLLGSFKPVTTRSLAMPLLEAFDDLFDATFSAKKNQRFQESIRKCVSKQNWPRLLLLWQEAVQLASNVLNLSDKSMSHGVSSHPQKRRRLESPKYQDLRRRWQEFNVEINRLQTQTRHGSSNLSFAFMEGTIVRAFRNGEWVLLDEINLASLDTLENIASLLHRGDEGGPSLLLTEAGSVDRIQGHENFRIFAAMNPATDAGKRDLAPSLRTRFTEIYVQPSDNELNSLLTLIHTYIGDLMLIDKSAASHLAQLYLDVKVLSHSNSLTDGANQRPHFSIRSLVRCLLFVKQHAASYGLRRAMYEGFAMSFCTMLSRDSERLVIPLLDRHILSGQKNARTLMRQTPRMVDDGIAYVSFNHHWVKKGALEPIPQPHYIRTPFVERNLLNLARASSMRRFPILLQGPTSSGKTSMVEYLAKISGNNFVRVNNHEHTDLQEYLGSYASGDDGKLQYRQGVLVEALRHGHWIVLDELNLAPTDVLEALNRLLDENRELFVPELQETVRPHPNFMLFATQNPAGVYGGRKHLSRAFRNRFLELHFADIPEDELEVILRERSQIAPSFCTRIVAVYKKLSLLRQSSRLFEQRHSFATLRDLFRWAKRRADNREQLALNGFMLLGERVRHSADRRAVKEVIEDVMKIKIDETTLYAPSRTLQMAPQTKRMVWTPAMKRVFVLVSEALDNDEPILLVGPTGCGKTQVCQTIAALRGKVMRTYNAHTNTETGDLIGAQRPVRHRAAIEEQLANDLKILMGNGPSDTRSSTANLTELIESFGRLETRKEDSDLVERIRSGILLSQSLFEWVDGSVVTAMRNGQYFLLDEISLADDSVLERLNSVLESSRTVLLAEKGTIDSSITAASGFQFLATMNPGGDYGKRELSAALRNRLTEIWVPPLSEDDDILPILRAQIETSLPGLAEVMVEFAKWFKVSFSTSTTISTPLRDLLAWAEFISGTSNPDIFFRILHGAAMVYIDALGSNPAGIFTLAPNDPGHARRRCVKKLGELLEHDVSRIYYDRPHLDMDDRTLQLGEFQIPVNSTAAREPELVFASPTTWRNAMRVLRGMQLSRPILLEGNPGVGKTALVIALAQAVGRPLTRINLSDQTDLMDLFGNDVPSDDGEIGRFAWRDGPFLQALQGGGWVLLDEMNLASQSVLEGLNSCIDHRHQIYVAELDQVFTCHPDFVLFAAQNPHHQGGGRKGLPASFVNRFTVVFADALGESDLTLICQSRFPTAPRPEVEAVLSSITFLNQEMTKASIFNSAGGPWDVNLRDATRWLGLCTQNTISGKSSQYFDTCLRQRFRSLAQRKVLDQIHAQIWPDSPERSLFHNLTLHTYQIGLAVLEREGSIQCEPDHSHQVRCQDLPIAESLIHCVNQRWPALLVGPSGCGKTTLLNTLAALRSARIFEISLNGDTDAMDLIGGYEQVDPQSHAWTFRHQLSNALDEYLGQQLSTMASDHLLTAVLVLQEKCRDTSQHELQGLKAPLTALVGEIPHLASYVEMLDDKNGNFCRETPRFGWLDGALVTAIEQGAWLVLDNANLCNPSVLDRLNSLLELDGELVISERHLADGSPRVIRPHPSCRIFITMDPKYGEISRALRNRCLEIYMDNAVPTTSDSMTISYPCDSNISRLRAFAHCQTGVIELEDELRAETAEVRLQNLSFTDLSSLPIIRDDLLAISRISSLGCHLDIYKDIPSKIFARTQALYRDPLDNTDIDHSFVAHQPVHPLVNEPVILSGRMETVFQRAMSLAWLQEALVSVIRAHQFITDMIAKTHTLNFSGLTALELSLVPQRLPAASRAQIQPIAASLQIMCKCLYDHLHARCEFDDSKSHSPTTTRELLTFFQDLLHMSATRGLQEGLLHTYLQIGREMSERARSGEPALAHEFSSALALFEAAWSLHYGCSLQRMWDTWRPRTASTMAQLKNLLDLEAINDRFDSLAMTTSLQTFALADIRSRLLQTPAEILKQAMDVNVLLLSLGKVLDELELSSHLEDPQASSYLQQGFESLCQIHDLHQVSSSDVERHGQIIALLAERPTRCIDTSSYESPVPSILHSIARFGGSESRKASARAWKGTFSLDIVAEVSLCRDQSIGELPQLTRRLEVMASSLSSSTVEMGSNLAEKLRDSVMVLLRQIVKSHQDFFYSGFPMRCWTDGDVMGDSSLIELFATSRSMDLLRPELPQDHYFHEIMSTYLLPASSFLISSRAKEFRTQNVGAALVCVCLATLHLFVPDKPFDPALDSQVRHDLHARHASQLTKRLQALESLERQLTGLTSSIRIRTVKGQLKELGNEPLRMQVVRPESSQLPLLHGEFLNLLQSIVIKRVATVLLSSIPGSFYRPDISKSRRLEEAHILRQNIDSLVQRLSNNFRAYADLTVPIVRTMQCLKLGVDMAGLEADLHTPAHVLVRLASAHTPFLGGRVALIHQPFSPSSAVRSESCEFDSRTFMLEHMVCYKTICSRKISGRRLDGQLLGLLEAYYDEWKLQLTKEQKLEAEKSRYYTYRGEIDSDEVGLRAEMEQVFPIYDNVVPATHTHGELSQQEPKSLSIKLASLLAKVTRSGDTQVQLYDHVMQVSRRVAELSFDMACGLSPIAPDALLPGALLLLHEELKRLQSVSTDKTINIYTDAHVLEAEKLRSLVHNLKNRFIDIGAAWPEHALPQDIRSSCNEVLTLKISDPIAKLLAKTERTHSLVYEWQIVASREYSVAALFDELTALIIHWRRLELSSWSQLLDVEKKKCDEDAQSWYFIVYEAVMSVPLRLLEAGEGLGRHAVDLAQILASFLRTTSAGQFSVRLRLLEDFNRLVIELTEKRPALSPVATALSNILSHFRRYEALIQQSLVESRAKLEIEIQEQIQLASWKDTNVTALRDSAKRSHQKLFRSIRKYRTLLAQPIEALKACTPSHDSGEVSLTSLTTGAWRLPAASALALETCQRKVRDWHLRPDRLKAPLGAAASIRHFYLSLPTSAEPHAELRTFADELSRAIIALRSQTPAKLTEETKDLVQHLKTQKRRLLADTLKKVRHMGVRRNLGSQELGTQSSLTMVLASTPGLPDARSASDCFHDFLDLLPDIRGNVQQHSDELTTAEVRRSCGSLEGLLSILRLQRSYLGPAFTDLEAVGTVVQQLSNLQREESDQTVLAHHGYIQKREIIIRQLPWLPQVLEVGCRVLSLQAKYGKLELGGLLDCLSSHQNNMQRLLFAMDDSPSLPRGLVNIRSIEVIDSAASALAVLNQDLISWMEADARVVHLLKQIIPWTEVSMEHAMQDTNGNRHMSSQDLDQLISNAADKVFVALQNLRNNCSEAPASFDDPAWLIGSDAELVSMIKTLRMKEVKASVDDAVGQVHQLERQDLDLGVSLLIVATPIFEQYYSVCQHVVNRYLALHSESCHLAYVLGKSFIKLASEGFCSPADATSSEQEQDARVESGTGLGDGKGAEDISKDVGDDEDLGELAQQDQADGEKSDFQDVDGAIDMRQEDLHGKMDDSGQPADNEDGDSDGETDVEKEDIEEEVGSVDNLDPSAVDEKMWDAEQKDVEEELQNDAGEGQASQEPTARKEKQSQERKPSDEAEEAVEDEAEGDEASVEDEGEAFGREEMNKTDAHLQLEQALELPDEMQLDGENGGDESDISDNEFDQVSDVDKDDNAAPPEDLPLGEDSENGLEEDSAGEAIDDKDAGDEVHSDVADLDAFDDEVMEDQDEELPDQGDVKEHLTRQDENAVSAEDATGGESGVASQTQDDREQDDQDPTNDGGQKAGKAENTRDNAPIEGEDIDGDAQQQRSSRAGARGDAHVAADGEGFKKLGDILDKWYRQRRETLKASDEPDLPCGAEDVDMAEADLEHVADEDDMGDGQALGSATRDQARTLDQSRAFEDPNNKGDDEHAPPDVDEDEEHGQDSLTVGETGQARHKSQMAQNDQVGAFIPERSGTGLSKRRNGMDAIEELEDVDFHSPTYPLSTSEPTAPISAEEASRLWEHYSSLMHPLSLHLTEQLRLILAPTQATKLRGDFRTGKRLNMKKIIPYIASQYKRDKIWKRRSIPSKRSYQIMVAVDDSKSMMEGGAGSLALETVALVCKSLSMLEVGEICVVGFGKEEHIRVAHPFDRPFTNEAGPIVFRHFGFRQTATDVRNLVAESITLFRDARAKSFHSQADLWQLELIISDGICEDHERIRRVVRQATEERIMIVFVIVDSPNAVSGGSSSIMDLTQASFEPDDNDDDDDENGKGKMMLTMKRYLDGFPFPYYLVVRDVRDLPGVLATALKGWFAEVVDAA